MSEKKIKKNDYQNFNKSNLKFNFPQSNNQKLIDQNLSVLDSKYNYNSTNLIFQNTHQQQQENDNQDYMFQQINQQQQQGQYDLEDILLQEQLKGKKEYESPLLKMEEKKIEEKQDQLGLTPNLKEEEEIIVDDDEKYFDDNFELNEVNQKNNLSTAFELHQKHIEDKNLNYIPIVLNNYQALMPNQPHLTDPQSINTNTITNNSIANSIIANSEEISNKQQKHNKFNIQLVQPEKNKKPIQTEEEQKLQKECQLNSEDDEDEQLQQELETNDLIIGHYEKVSHKHKKWTVILKDLIAKMNGKEYIFRQLNGNYEFD
eukprot:TRINITY_DN29918_c0_g1_i1.p1 TRINITY_DN29918_c0_g1~~TRINITY_DN29918_c0_g1_i1.p1  ORF type:complete len:317 (+),score=80.43 TRINITY_DN29918_c0_g1_i1:134-1084(+)